MKIALEAMLESLSSEIILEEMKDSLLKWSNTSKDITISLRDIRRLSESIVALPNDAQNLLIGNYVFNLSEKNLSYFFDISDADIKLIFFERLLSKSIMLPVDARIDDKSMEKSCRRALTILIKDDESNRKNNILIYIGKTIAAMLAVAIISFAVAMSANAEFREQMIKWFIESTKQYTIFNMENKAPLNSLESQKYVPLYVPDRYHLSGNTVSPGITTYIYEDSNGDILDISICMPGFNAYINTENMSKENVVINGTIGYLYHNGINGSLSSNIDGYALYVTGKVSREELVKIAEEVSDIE